MQCLEFPITNTLLGRILSIFLSERFRNLARWTGQNPLHTTHPLSKFWTKLGEFEYTAKFTFTLYIHLRMGQYSVLNTGRTKLTKLSHAGN